MEAKLLNLMESAADLPYWKSDLLLDLEGVKIKFGKINSEKIITEEHDVDEFLLVLSGQLFVTMNGERHTMQAFDCVIVPRNTKHTVESPQETVYLVARRRPD